MTRQGLTLIELLISIAITVVIAGAIYLSLNAALESWGYSKDRLALQKVLNDVMEEITNGIADSYGLKDGLEIVTAGNKRVEFVPPWTDDTHTITTKDFIYTLNRKIKPGAAIPITEIKIPESTEYMSGAASLIEQTESPTSQLRLVDIAPSGSQLRFTYHPDPKVNPDVVKAIWWDSEDGEIYSEHTGEVKSLSKNPFGVKIIDFSLRYYDNANNLITEDDWIEPRDLCLITAIEVLVTTQMSNYKTSLLSFVSLRNAPLRSGYLPLQEGIRIPVADSKSIHTFLLSNISGVENEDVLSLEAIPDSGKSWKLEIVFSKIGFAKPRIDRYTIEYPPGNTVHTAYPNTSADLGLNLILLDSRGLYDYDDDEDIEDVVMLEGKVFLNVKEMDIEGAGMFIRP